MVITPNSLSRPLRGNRTVEEGAFTQPWIRFFTEISQYAPTGSGMIWYGDVGEIPKGWLLCDNAIYSISLYQALFNAIGSVYGGDGVSNFAVPPQTLTISEIIKT